MSHLSGEHQGKVHGFWQPVSAAISLAKPPAVDLLARIGGMAPRRERYEPGRVRPMATLGDIHVSLPGDDWCLDWRRSNVREWRHRDGDRIGIQYRAIQDRPLRNRLGSRERVAAYFAGQFELAGFALLVCRMEEVDGQPAAAVIASPTGAEAARGYLGAIAIPLRRYSFVVNLTTQSMSCMQAYLSALLPSIRLSARAKAEQAPRRWLPL